MHGINITLRTLVSAARTDRHLETRLLIHDHRPAWTALDLPDPHERGKCDRLLGAIEVASGGYECGSLQMVSWSPKPPAPFVPLPSE